MKIEIRWNEKRLKEEGYEILKERPAQSVLSIAAPRTDGTSLWQAVVPRLRDSAALEGAGYLEIPNGTPRSGATPEPSSSTFFNARKLAQDHHIFLGHDAGRGRRPVLVSKKIFSEHVHIMGSSGSGKTAKGLVPMAEQLIGFGDAAVIIIDLKGDMAFFAAAQTAAQRANARFKWFTTELGRSTYVFNPFSQDLGAGKLSLPQLSSSLAEALGLDRGDGYGASFFSRVNRQRILEVLTTYQTEKGTAIGSFFRFWNHLNTKLKEKEKRDAFELLAAVEILSGIEQLNLSTETMPGEHPDSDSEKLRPSRLKHAIHMLDAVREKQVLYFNFPQAIEGSTAREIGRLDFLTQEIYQ